MKLTRHVFISFLLSFPFISVASAQDDFTRDVMGTSSDSSQSGFLNEGSDISLGAPEGATMENDGQAYYDGVSPEEMVRSGGRKHFKLTPFIGAEATYTDNINLSHNNKESGMLYNIYGGVRGDVTTNRFDGAGTAAGNIYWNNKSNNVDVSPHVEAAGTAEILRNRLFIDGLANYTTTYETAGARSSTGAGDGLLNGIGSVSVSPYWRQKIGNWAVGELRYGYDAGFSEADGVGDMQTHSYQATLGTGDRFNRYSLKGRLAHIDSSYSNPITNANGDMKQSTAELIGSYGLTQRLALLGTIGYDEVSGANIPDDEYSGEFWGAGAEYRPNSRARIMGMYGRRNNAPSYLAEASYQLNNAYAGVTAMTSLAPPSGYNHNTLRLSGQQLADFNSFLDKNKDKSVAEAIRTKYNIRDGQMITSGGEAVIVGNGQNLDPYRNRTVTGYMGGNLKNLNVSGSLTYDERDFKYATDEKAMIATAGLGYQLTQRLSTSLEGFYYALETDVKRNESWTYGGGWGLQYALTKNVSAYTLLRHTERKANVRQFEYKENAATIGISANF